MFLLASVVVDVEVLVIGVLGLKKECLYVLAGDLNDDCRVGFYDCEVIADNWLTDVDFSDFAIMAGNWLIDCDTEPYNAACVPE